jgi:hypothetical protein
MPGSAWDGGQPWLDEILPQLRANRDWLAVTLAAELPGVTMAGSGGDVSGLARLPGAGIAVHGEINGATLGRKTAGP